MPLPNLTGLLGVLLAAFLAAVGYAQEVAEILKATGTDAGVVVHLGTDDGRLEAELARRGRFLVHGLAWDQEAVDKSRRGLIREGLYGVASVERCFSQPQLPYAENLVNLLIADTALLARQEIDRGEVLRVLVPGGAAYLKDQNGWKVVRKSWPDELDHWTHFDYDCTNNAVSGDRRVGPITTLKWISGYRSLRYGKSASGAYRCWGGLLVHELKTVDASGRSNRLLLAVRDGFNGLPRWFMPIQSTSGNGLQGIVVDEGTIFTMANPDDPRGPMRAIELGSGRELVRFDAGGMLETTEQAGGDGHAYGSGAPRWARILYHQGKLFQAANHTLYALDPKTGACRWTYRDPAGHRLLLATFAPDLGLVFVANTEKAKKMVNDWNEWNSRWPASKLVAITAVRADSGRVAWRNEQVAGQTAGQLVYNAGRLAYFSPSGIGAMGFKRDTESQSWTWMGVIDAQSGRLKWSRDYRRDPPALNGRPIMLNFAFTIVLRDDRLFVCANNYLTAFDAETGRVVAHLVPPIRNARCTRSRSTRDYHVMGFGTFIGKDMATTINQNITRSDCMTGPTIANGMIYHTPNGCGCFAMIRGFAGYGAEPPWEPLPVEARLLPARDAPPAQLLVKPHGFEKTATMQVREGHGQSPRTLRVPVYSGNLIRNAWTSNDVLPYPETEPVGYQDLNLVAVVNEHRLEARRSGTVVWSFVAGGRISTPPLVHDGRVYVAAHDGRVSCLDGRTGRLIWQFLAAPNDRRMVAYGQLESSWPVYGVVEHQGLICASAGRHPELDGGIYFYGLEPLTGRPRWQGRLHVEAETLVGGSPAGKPRNWQKPANTMVNAPLQVKDGRLVLVSADLTNEGISAPCKYYELPIDPNDPPR